MKKKYKSMIRRAREKDLPVNLTFEEFRKIKFGDCEYCGVSELLLRYYCQVMSINTPWMSIDRKDNLKGYTRENCVSACYLCNKIKGSFFSYEDMRSIGKNFVKPKLIEFEKEAMEAFKDWCEDNVLFDEEIESWSPCEF